MDILSKLPAWAKDIIGIRAILLVGSRVPGSSWDDLSDFDLSVFGHDFDFIGHDAWLDRFGPHLLCIHERFLWGETEIPTRLTIFEDFCKVDFSFHPLSLLQEMVKTGKLSATYDGGYEVLLDKDQSCRGLPLPRYQAYTIRRPDENEFRNCMREFWFEAYHVAKYIARNDLWPVLARDHDLKKWLLHMLEWNAAYQSEFRLRVKGDGKNMKAWIPREYLTHLEKCFAGTEGSTQRSALYATMDLFRKVGRETATMLAYDYNEQADRGITKFIQQLIP